MTDIKQLEQDKAEWIALRAELFATGAMTGGIWKTRPVDEVPVIELVKWNVFAVPSPKGDDVDHHFNGYNPAGQEGRVSSKIMEFDHENMIGTTRSGRKYQLIGIPAYDGDAFYVYRNWLAINKVTDEDVTDATGDYLTPEQKKFLRPDLDDVQSSNSS